MAVARVSTMVFFVSGLVAVGVLLAPAVGLRHHPRGCFWVSVAGASAAVGVVAMQLAVPLTQGTLLAWPQNYFLAMAHSLNADTPYPFFWSPRWAYVLGTLSPVIAAGGLFALGAGYPALRAGHRGALASIAVGIGATLAFVLGAVLGSMDSWHGVPV
jgi:hypothetical protein